MTRGEGAETVEGALAEGDELGKYRIDRAIGRGGAGEVYAATNLATGRAVALKILKNPLASDDERRRFLREARASTAIDHPNVIDVLDVFEHSACP